MRRKPRKRKQIPWEIPPAPAPGDLALVQAFVNTVDRKVGGEQLTTPQALASWLTHRSLLAADVVLGRAERRRALELREALRALLAANNGVRLAAKTVERLDRVAQAAGHQLRFGPGGAARLETGSKGFDDALGRLLQIVAAAQLAGRWPLMKACADPDCRAAFHDASRNHTGRWCTRRCGNRANTRALRRRGGPRSMRKRREEHEKELVRREARHDRRMAEELAHLEAETKVR